MTIFEMARSLRARKVSSAELVQAALDCAERLQPRLNAFLTVMADSARAQAREADAELARGVDRGPLHGIPIAVKDLFCTRGVRTTNGSRIFADFVPDYDAAVIERLSAAGAVLIGKTGQHELAYGITSTNPHFGAVRNPWNPECVPGGSSGGSGAAVGAGIVPMAMGSDTGGSIRIPAAYCGTVGLKPTYGRVSKYGALPLGFSLDHMGPLTRSVRDSAAVLNVLAGPDSRDACCSAKPSEDYVPPEGASVRGTRIGVPENFYFEHVDPSVEEAVRRHLRTAEQLGAVLVPIRVPDVDALNTISRVLLFAEASAAMQKYMDRRDEIGPDVRALLDQGRLVPATDYVNAQRLRTVFRRDFGRVWQKVDCFATPATPTSAPRIGQTTTTAGGFTADVRLMATRFVRGINVLGWPALAAPCGLDSSGMPVSLQLVGRPFDEAGILRAGAALEDATGFHRLQPALPDD
jgi:aspartyl-tRNA(Asn)/glutamyl-tRNA(Gln) amidotransferase subunit A